MKIHASITMARVMRLVRKRDRSLDNPGICLNCGKGSNNCEPDARNYQCDHCHERQVFGAEEILFML